MRITLAEASRQLALHPCELVALLASMVSSPADCWPEIDDGFVETIRQLRKLEHQSDSSLKRPEQELAKQAPTVKAAMARLNLSRDQVRILDKLERKDRWGGNKVPMDVVKNHYCHGIEDFEDCVASLNEMKLILVIGRAAMSLNPDARGEIEAIVNEARASAG